MAVPTVTITCASFLDSTSKVIKCDRVSVSHKRNLIANANANPPDVAEDVVEVQAQGYENPIISIQGIRFTDASGVFTYKNGVELMKHQFDGTNAPVLTITYSTGGAKTLSNNVGATSGISVIAKSFDISLDASDSKDAHLPIGSLTLIETG